MSATVRVAVPPDWSFVRVEDMTLEQARFAVHSLAEELRVKEEALARAHDSLRTLISGRVARPRESGRFQIPISGS